MYDFKGETFDTIIKRKVKPTGPNLETYRNLIKEEEAHSESEITCVAELSKNKLFVYEK